jgi:glutathione S-transferase
MPHTLAIGDRAYSSWSLRGWLLCDAFSIPVTTRLARLYSDDLARVLADFPPARTVPALRCDDGTVIPDSLAIAEELATRHPAAGIWPADPTARATARALAAEMHAGFSALRNHCPMNLRVAYAETPVPDAVLADLARLDTIWSHARSLTGAPTWLCGDYSAADAFFAPVAARIATYALPVSPAARAYVAAHLAHPSFRRWRAMGLVDLPDQRVYARPYPPAPWPGPAPLPARAIADGQPENDTCPFSGDAVTHLAWIEGRIIGFCNAFCRDKTVADPLAWPEVAVLLGHAPLTLS